MDRRSKLRSLRDKSSNLALEIERDRTINQRVDYLKEQISDLDNFLGLAVPYCDSLVKLSKLTKDTYADYQQGRIKFIEDSLEEVISELFPNSNFRPRIRYTHYRNEIRSELVLIDQQGYERFPRITEGGFMKQLIGFSSAIKVLELVGSKTFYLDEAFSNASATKKEQMANIISKCLDNGLQLILISQSPECYDSLPRREFILDTKNNRCVLTDVRDYDGR